MNDTHLLNLAQTVSKRSTCLGIKVGAVIAHDSDYLALGWNLQPDGVESCQYRGHCSTPGHTCLTQNAPSRAIHAEVVAIGNASKAGIRLQGATLYVNHIPCFNCLKSAVASGIKRVVWYGESYAPNDPIYQWASKALILEAVPNPHPQAPERPTLHPPALPEHPGSCSVAPL